MRNLKRNKVAITALNYIGEVEILVDGVKTGSKKITYSEPYVFMGHISGAKGTSQEEMFGTDISYSKVIVLDLIDFEKFGIDENTVMFVDKEPEYDSDNLPLYNYIVVRKAITLNQVSLAVEKVR